MKRVWSRGGNHVEKHKYADACTHSTQGIGPEEGWPRPAQGATQGCTSLHRTMLRGRSWCKESGGQAYIFWWMFTFYSWYQARWGIDGPHTWPHTGCTCLCRAMKRGWSNKGSQVDKHTCTDSYTHCNLGIGQKRCYWTMQAWSQRTTHVCTIMQREWSWHGVNMHLCTDTCTHSNDNIGEDEGIMDHT